MELLNYEVLEKSGYDGYILKDAPEKVINGVTSIQITSNCNIIR